MPRVLTCALTLLLLGGCASGTTPDGGRAANPATTSASARAADALLDSYGLAGRSAVELVDILDRMPVSQRPAELRASVRPHSVEVSGPGTQSSLPIPADRFYLSVAPYRDSTHDCFHHSLTTCRGELGDREVHVVITQDGGRVLVDEDRRTFDNGFVGFWLPRDIAATVTVTVDGMTGRAPITTGADDPTCLTTLRVA